MNNTLSSYARQQLKEGLSKCTEPQQLLFKRMYSHENIELTINEVVDNMPNGKLDLALSQVEATIRKNNNGK